MNNFYLFMIGVLSTFTGACMMGILFFVYEKRKHKRLKKEIISSIVRSRYY